MESLFRILIAWAEQRQDILALGLVGSYARGTQRADSDIDLMLVVTDPAKYRQDQWPATIPWAQCGRSLTGWRDADYGRVWSRHLRLDNGLETELSFGPPDWAAVDPLDPGTARVLRDGCRILSDPQGLLDRALAVLTPT